MDEKREHVSITPPRFSLGKVFQTIGQKGIVKALEDTEQGPHVHLTLLLITVVLVSGLIILVSTLL
jgi:hypothetical protein